MTFHERMKTACGRQHLGTTAFQSHALSSNVNCSQRKKYSQSKKCAQEKHDRHLHDASTAQKYTETSQKSAPLTEPSFQSHCSGTEVQSEMSVLLGSELDRPSCPAKSYGTRGASEDIIGNHHLERWSDRWNGADYRSIGAGRDPRCRVALVTQYNRLGCTRSRGLRRMQWNPPFCRRP